MPLVSFFVMHRPVGTSWLPISQMILVRSSCGRRLRPSRITTAVEIFFLRVMGTMHAMFLTQSGELKRVGELSSPWPCFMIASTAKRLADPAFFQSLQNVSSVLSRLLSFAYPSFQVLEGLRKSVEHFMRFRFVFHATLIFDRL